MISFLSNSKKLDCTKVHIRQQVRDQLYKMLKKHDWNGEFFDLLQKLKIPFRKNTKRQSFQSEKYIPERRQPKTLFRQIRHKVLSCAFEQAVSADKETVAMIISKRENRMEK